MRLFLTALLIASSVQAEEVTVAAAASLQDALRALTPLYEAKTHDKVVYNFGGSNALARQIQAGAPVDVFFSADEPTMDSVPTTDRHDVVANRLLILGNLRTARRVALANPAAVPAGVYARRYLERVGLWREVAPKVVPTENVRAALAAVEAGNADAGIVYKTDAGISKKVKVAFEVPRAEGPKISYPFAVVAATRQPDAARRLLAWLESADALAVFQKYGFLLAGGT